MLMAGIFAEMNANRYPLLFVIFMVFETYAIKYYVRHDSLFFIFGKVSYIRFINRRKGVSLVCDILRIKNRAYSCSNMP